jgi:hypothetical protein
MLARGSAYMQMKNIADSVLLHHRLAIEPGHRVEQKMWYQRGLARRRPAGRLDG